MTSKSHWVKYTDPASGQAYYYDSINETSVWDGDAEAPKEYIDMANPEEVPEIHISKSIDSGSNISNKERLKDLFKK